MSRATALTVVALSLFIASPAAAESKSWKAVSKAVPSGATVVFGANLAPIRATGSFSGVLKLILEEDEDAKQVIDLVKSTCAVDVAAVISDVTVIVREGRSGEETMAVFGLDGLDEGKVIACVEKVAKQMGGGGDVKIGRKKKGKLTEYAIPGQSHKIYAAWLAPDVIAFGDNPEDKAALTKLLVGSKPRGALATTLAKVSTTAPMWVVSTMKDKESWGTMLGGWGQLDIAAGTLSASGHLLTSNAAEATAALADGEQGLAEAKAEAAKLPLALKLLNTVKLSASGAQVDVTASTADKDFAALLPQLDKIF